jgi:hypothetical protein
MWWLRAGDKKYFFQLELISGAFCQNQVTDVDWIKCAAEQANVFHR